MEQVKKEHEQHVVAIEDTYREHINEVDKKGNNENAEITAKFERKIEKLETNSKAKITELEGNLQ